MAVIVLDSEWEGHELALSFKAPDFQFYNDLPKVNAVNWKILNENNFFSLE